MTTKLDPSTKIDMLESFATIPVSMLLGAASGLLAGLLGWPTIVSLTFTVVLVLLFLSTPLAGMIRAFVRRKAEAYYYGT